MTDLDRLDALAADHIPLCGVCGDYSANGVEVHAICLASLVAAVRERDELRAAAGAVMLALEPEVLPRTLNRKIPVLQYDSASIARLDAALHREDGA